MKPILRKRALSAALASALPWLAGCENQGGAPGGATQEAAVTDSAPPAPAHPLLQGLLFHAGFEDSLAPSFSKGSEKTTCDGATFADGVVGKSIAVSKDGYTFHTGDNFDYGRGTISFWIKPSWKGSDVLQSGGARGLFNAINFTLAYEPPPGKSRFFFMTGNARPPDGFVWDYGVASDEPRNWKDGEWHHVLASWDTASRAKSLYFDGRLAARGTTEWMRPGAFTPAEKTALGSLGSPGAYDELTIWNRMLSAEEIALLCGKPADASAILRAAPPPVKQMKIAWPITFTIKKIEPPVASIVAPGDTFTTVVPVENQADAAYTGQATFSLIDFWGKTREAKKVDVNLAPKEKKELTIPFVIPERGPYKVSVSLDVSGTRLERDMSSLGCWPAPAAPPDPESFFGNHVNTWGGAYLDQAQRLGQGWMRDHNMLQATWWMSVQPEPGEFKWKESDGYINDHTRRGMKVLGQLFSTPYWAAKGGPVAKFSGYPKPIVPDSTLWEKYVFETVSHFKDRITYWEIQNEPEVSMFWGGSPEEFAEVCRVAYTAAKKADPDCVVMVGGLTFCAWKWHEQMAKAGAFKSCDVISLHYGCPLDPPERVEEELNGVLEHFQDLAVKYGPGKRMPIWNTEGGTPDTTWLNGLDYEGLAQRKTQTPEMWRVGAIHTIKDEALMQLKGIAKHFIYLQNHVSPGPGCVDGDLMLELTNAPTPKLMARVAFAAQVDGARCVGDVRRNEGRFWSILYERKDGKGSVALCWAGDKGEVKLSLDSADVTKLIDLMGNERKTGTPVVVTDEPFFFNDTATTEKLKSALEKAKLTIVKEPVKLPTLAAGEEKPAVPVLPNFVAPMESPASVFQIDLKPFCTMAFADDKAGDGKGGWADEGPMNDMRDMPLGRQIFYGVPFDIIDPASNNGKSIITLKGVTTQTLPEKVEIKVPSKKCRALYFLHSAGWGSPGDIGKYVVRYADGSSVDVPVKITENCNNWWFGYDHEEVSRPVPVRVTNTSTGKPAWRYPRVFEWQNRKDQAIVGIDFISKGGPQVPILIAITGV